MAAASDSAGGDGHLEPLAAGRNGEAGRFGFGQAVEAEQGEALARADGAERAEMDLGRHHLRAGGGRRREADRHDAFARGLPEVDAGHDLLSDVAALLEIDAVQMVEVGVVGKGVAVDEIDAALGHAEPDPVRGVAPGRVGVGCGEDRARADHAPAEIGVARVAHDEIFRGRRRGAPHGGDAERGRAIGDRHLRAQLLEVEPLGQIRGLTCETIEQKERRLLARRGDDDEVEQQLALRTEEGGIARIAPFHGERAVREQPMEQIGRVGAADGDDAALGQEA